MKWIIFLLLLPSLAFAGQGMGPGPGGKTYSAGGGGISDDFTGTNGTALATHNSAWVNANSTYTVANLNIQSNMVQPVDVWSTGGARYTGGGDVSQIVYKGGRSGAADTNYVAVRMNGTTLGYSCAFSNASGGNWTEIVLQKNGNWESVFATGTWAQASDHTVRVRASGTTPTTVYCSVDGGTEYSAVDSASPYTTGLPGFVAYADGTAANSVFDTWAGQ